MDEGVVNESRRLRWYIVNDEEVFLNYVTKSENLVKKSSGKKYEYRINLMKEKLKASEAMALR